MDPGCFPTPRPHDLSLTKWLERALLADILLNTPDFRLTVSNLPRSQAILHGASHGVGINRALDCKEIASFPLGSRRGGTVRVGSPGTELRATLAPRGLGGGLFEPIERDQTG